jgi:hypothetical protein
MYIHAAVIPAVMPVVVAVLVSLVRWQMKLVTLRAQPLVTLRDGRRFDSDCCWLSIARTLH